MLTIKYKNIDHLIKAVIVISILIILSLFWFSDNPLYSYIGYPLIGLLTVILIYIYKITYKQLANIIIISSSILIFKLISQFITGNLIGLYLYITLFTGLVLGYLAIKRDSNNIIIKTFYYYSFLYLILIFLLLLVGRDPNEIWLGSRNLIGQLFVSFGALFLIYKPTNLQLKSQNIYYLLLLFVCVLSTSRSAIVTSFILLLVHYLQVYSSEFNQKKLLLGLVSFIAILFLFVNIDYYINFFNNYEYFSRLREYGLEDHSRDLMRKEFIGAYNISTFFFGVDLSTLPYIHSFNNNPHNAFIAMNANLGLLGIIIIFQILKLLFNSIVAKEFTVALAILTIILRLLSDSISPLIYIPVLFLFVYSFFYRNK